MKFQHLKVGQKFEYQGNSYVKSSPLLATHSESGEQKLIPRYATVVVTDSTLPPHAKDSESNISSDKIRFAFDKFYDCVQDSLLKLEYELEADTLTSMQQRLATARQQFLDELARLDQVGNVP